MWPAKPQRKELSHREPWHLLHELRWLPHSRILRMLVHIQAATTLSLELSSFPFLAALGLPCLFDSNLLATRDKGGGGSRLRLRPQAALGTIVLEEMAHRAIAFVCYQNVYVHSR
jgi:hypothetical protein